MIFDMRQIYEIVAKITTLIHLINETLLKKKDKTIKVYLIL